MSLKDDVRILSQVDFFEGIQADQLRLLAFGGETKMLFAGADLFLQNTKSDCGYVVISGLIDLTVTFEDSDQLLTSIGPGGLVGEMSLITESLRSTNAIARCDSKVFCIPRKLFIRLLEKYPELAYDIHQKISRSVCSIILQLDKVRLNLTYQKNKIKVD